MIVGKLSSRQTRIARSGLPNILTIKGIILVSKSSDGSLLAILRVTEMAFGPPPPNSTDFINSGRTFILKKSSGKSSEALSS